MTETRIRRVPEEHPRPLAIIGANPGGTYGIVWRRFEWMEYRGGYSGPFTTVEDAEARARVIAEYYTGRVPRIVTVPELPEE